MTKEPHDTASESAGGIAAGQDAVIVLDWRQLADQRLARLVELEHDHAVMYDRLALLQFDFRQVLVANEDQLQRIIGLDRQRLELERRLAGLARDCADAREAFAATHASIMNSRSWRLTRPLRAVSAWWVTDRHSLGGAVRAMLRVPLLRRGARFMVRKVPRLHARLRARLYPQSGRTGGGDLQ